MSTTELLVEPAIDTGSARPLDTKLEIVVLPVSDVDRAKSFYDKLGWRLDADYDDGAGFPGMSAEARDDENEGVTAGCGSI